MYTYAYTYIFFFVYIDITDDVLKCLKSIKVFMELESTGYQSIMNIKEESEKYKHLLSDL